jgi:hypothetical protein
MWFRVPTEEALFRSSSGREFATHRVVPRLRLWVGGRRLPGAVPSVWDTAADFLTLSETAALSLGIEFDRASETITTSGIGGPLVGVFAPLRFQFDQIDTLRHTAFSLDCVVVLGTAFPVPLLGNLFVRRNFNVQTIGERRTFFRLREHAPDAVPATRLHAP